MKRRLGDVGWIALGVLLSAALAFSVRGGDWLYAGEDVVLLLFLPTLRAASRYRP